MTSLGLKKITPNNWLVPDTALRGFVRISPDGQFNTITGEEHLQHILRPKLLESVPRDVQALFEVARGTMVYGYFFYPLFTLAAEQLFRVVEAALAHKCKVLSAPKSNRTFERKIKWLVEEGVISNQDSTHWHAARQMRNLASHPKNQMILSPGNAIGTLQRVADDINSLFISN